MGSRDARIDIDRPAGPSSQTLRQRVGTHKLLLAVFFAAVLTLVTVFSLAVKYRLANRSLPLAMSVILIIAGLVMCVFLLFWQVYICLSEDTRDAHLLADLRDRISTRRQNIAPAAEPSRRRSPWQMIKASAFPTLAFSGIALGFALVIASSNFASLNPYRPQLAASGVFLTVASFALAVMWVVNLGFADYPLAAWRGLRTPPRVARRREAAGRAGEDEEDPSSRPREASGQRDAKKAKADESSARGKGVKNPRRRHWRH